MRWRSYNRESAPPAAEWMAMALLALAGCHGNVQPAEGLDLLAATRVTRLTFAEFDFKQANGRYGALPDMIQFRPDLGAEMVGDQYAGHRLVLSLTDAGFTLRADLVQPGPQSKFSFYSDQLGIVRQSEGTAPASASSPLLHTR
jgi:hypothetical protein